MSIRSQIIGLGTYLPSSVLTNEALEARLDTSDEWIKSRTGIAQRHIAAKTQGSAYMAVIAAKAALEDAKIDINAIDLIINCTTTPDHRFPSSAAKIQADLGLKSIPAFDLQAVCAGFIYGIDVADNLIKSGKYRTILLTFTEKMSKLLNWDDRNTAILFGDGAGAVILQQNDKNKGVIDSNIYSDGSFYDLLYVAHDGIKMNGREVFKHAIEKMESSILSILAKNNLSIDDINYFIPHQANIRIIDTLASRLKMDTNKVVVTIAKHANCSAASIPLALNQLKISDRLKSNDILLFSAFGAGFTWGSALVQW